MKIGDQPMRATLTRDELRSRHLGHHALRRFCAEMGVPVDAVKGVGDIGCIVGRAIGRVRAADRERAWQVAEAILTELDAQHFDEGGEA